MITMVEYAVAVGSVGTMLFGLIRNILAIFTDNTVMFAFIVVAVFGLALSLAATFFKNTVKMVTTALDERQIRIDEFDLHVKAIRKDADDLFDLDEAEQEITGGAPDSFENNFNRG